MFIVLFSLCAGTILSVYLFAPMRINLLILGIDYADPGSFLSRTDTLILATFNPFEPYVRMLSIPRDLWVNIPGYGENRINTAHFYAEAQQPGNGPQATLDTVKANFGVEVDYYIRVRFEAFREVINELGGVDIELKEPMGGYEPGLYHLTGRKALAFVRHRANSDDFFRMKQGQLMVKAIYKTMKKPQNWLRIPAVMRAFFRTTDTNIPIWVWPRLALSLLRVGPDGMDSRIIEREMVTPFVTVDGANVLQPNWGLINPVVKEMFWQ